MRKSSPVEPLMVGWRAARVMPAPDSCALLPTVASLVTLATLSAMAAPMEVLLMIVVPMALA